MSDNEKNLESQGVDLNNPAIGKAIANRVLEEIEEYTKTSYNDGFRWHLGASKIGDECSRALWYGFRWISGEAHSGRMQRLFNRGHLEEKRHAEWLRGIGFQLWTHDESIVKSDGTFAQFRIKNQCKGHLGGSLDGIARFPERYNIDLPVIVESKTSGTGAGFNKTKEQPVSIAKPAHYIQNSIYGRDYGIEHILYVCANKNDDDLAIKVEKLDFKLADQMIAKAEKIIFSQTPPARLSENPAHVQCKSMCQFKEVCFFNKPIEKNCRSCSNASAVDNGEFYCSVHQGVIPRDYVKSGCESWKSIVIVESKIIVSATKPKQDTGMFEIEDVDIPY